LKREKKEQERIIKRFKVLTVDDFQMADLIKAGELNKEGDSWGL